jgi:hypothetical protein
MTDHPLSLAEASLDAARATLEAEQAKLGEARGTLADHERALETLADAMAAAPAEDYRQRYALRVEDVDRQRGIVRALERRCAACRAEAARLEAALAEADEREYGREMAARRAALVGLGERFDTLAAELEAVFDQVVEAARAFREHARQRHRSRWDDGLADREALEASVRQAVGRRLPFMTALRGDEFAARRQLGLEAELCRRLSAFDPPPPPVELALRRPEPAPQPPTDPRSPDPRWSQELPIGLRRVPRLPEMGSME